MADAQPRDSLYDAISLNPPDEEPPPFIPLRRRPPITVIRAMAQQIQDFLHDAVNTEDPEWTRACCNLAAMEADGILEVVAWLETWRPPAALRAERIIT